MGRTAWRIGLVKLLCFHQFTIILEYINRTRKLENTDERVQPSSQMVDIGAGAWKIAHHKRSIPHRIAERPDRKYGRHHVPDLFNGAIVIATEYWLKVYLWNEEQVFNNSIIILSEAGMSKWRGQCSKETHPSI